MKLHKALATKIFPPMQKSLISTLSLAKHEELLSKRPPPIKLPPTIEEALVTGIPLKEILKTYRYNGDSFEYNAETFPINSRLLDKKSILSGQIDVLKTLAPHLTVILPTEENCYYLYHTMRLKRAEKCKKVAEEYQKKLAAEKDLHTPPLPEQGDVEAVGQEPLLYYYDWLAE